MLFRETGAHLFALFLVRQAGHGRFEEEDAEDGEEDEQFEQDEPHEGPSPGHVPETVPVEMPDACDEVCHGLGFNTQSYEFSGN